jgi:hypothetical protein
LLLLSLRNENAMKNLLNDNQLLNEKLNQALSLLIKYSNSSSSSNKSPKFKAKNYNNFQAANLLLANLNNLCSTNNIKPDASPKALFSNQPKSSNVKTLNESLVDQMIEQFDWLKTAALHADTSPTASQSPPASSVNVFDSLDKLEKLIQRIKLTRNNKFARLYQPVDCDEADLFLNVCNKCTGQVKIV